VSGEGGRALDTAVTGWRASITYRYVTGGGGPIRTSRAASEEQGGSVMLPTPLLGPARVLKPQARAP
jgi:hypothetical protein